MIYFIHNTWCFHPKSLILPPHSIRIFPFPKSKPNSCNLRQSYKAHKILQVDRNLVLKRPMRLSTLYNALGL